MAGCAALGLTLAGCATGPDPYAQYAWNKYQRCLQTGEYHGYATLKDNSPATVQKWCTYDYNSLMSEFSYAHANSGVTLTPVVVSPGSTVR